MKIFVIKLIAFYLACLSCYLLQTTFGLSAVFSAALIGFVGSFWWFSKGVEKSGIHAVIYAGSFAGMASPQYLSNPGLLFLTSILGTALYLWSVPRLSGFGGKLGTISFAATILIILLQMSLS